MGLISHTLINATLEYEKEHTYNVNMESLKGGAKHLRHSEYTIYTDGRKKEEGMGAGL